MKSGHYHGNVLFPIQVDMRGARAMNQEREMFPTAIEATLLIAGLFAVEMLIGAALHDAKSTSGIDPRDVAGAVAVLGNGVLFSLLMHYKRATYASLFHASKTSVAATIGTLTLPILSVVPGLTLAVWTLQTILVELFPVSRWQQAMFDQMMSNGFASVVTVCFIAPVLEEMLFRGVILRSFLLQYTRWKAILGSAFLFGLAHLNVYQFLVGAVLGTVSGWLYERTRSLWPSILLHGAYNATVSAIYYSSSSDEMMLGWRPSTIFWATACILAFGGTVVIQRLLLGRRVPA